MEQVIIGVDPHKLSATIEVVDHHEGKMLVRVQPGEHPTRTGPDHNGPGPSPFNAAGQARGSRFCTLSPASTVLAIAPDPPGAPGIAFVIVPPAARPRRLIRRSTRPATTVRP